MDYLVLDGLPPWDGRYEFDLDGAPLTITEWGWIKRYSGYLPLTIGTGLAGADAELMLVFAAIALRRNDRLRDEDVAGFVERMGDSPFEGRIRLELGAEDEAEDEADAPLANGNGSTPISGESLKTPSDPSDGLPPPIGMPASAISESDPAR